MKLLLPLVLVAFACNTGNDYLPAASTSDLESPADLTLGPPDMSTTGPSCGQIAMCVIGCAQDPTCLGNCVMGADPTTLTELGGLLLCAGTSCLATGDGGIGAILGGGGLGSIDQGQLIMCLIGSCSQQLGMCPGLFPGL